MTMRPLRFLFKLAGLMMLVAATLCAESLLSSRSELAKENEPIKINVSGKELRLSRQAWKAMKNRENYALNFEALVQKDKEVFGQVVTVFLLAMSPSRKAEAGTKFSENEYVEIFTAHPDTITIQISREQRGYWVLSRQTFKIDNRFDFIQVGKLYEDAEFRLISALFDNQIDTTRFLLADTF